MMNQQTIKQEKTGYWISDVIVNLVLQVMMFFLVKFIADSFGLVTTIGFVGAYLLLLVIFQMSMTPYFNKNRPANLRREVNTALTNSSWFTVALVSLFVYISISIRCVSLNFYFHDYVDQQSLMAWLEVGLIHVGREDAFAAGVAVFIMFGVLVQIIGVLLLSLFISLYRKKDLFILCLLLTAFFTALFYIPAPDDINLIFLLFLLKSLVFAPTIPLLWAMISHDINLYDEFGFKQQATSFGFSGVAFTLKAGLALGAIFVCFMLLSYGYMPEAKNVHSWTVMQCLRWLSSIIPSIFMIVGAILFLANDNTKSEKI